MASADLRKELECSVCLSFYKDPMNLKCGHNFCRVCIERVLETQQGSGRYSCPECREQFWERPALHKNVTLRNIVGNFSTHPHKKDIGISCTYCVDSPIPAVKTCVLCDAYLCEKHLKFHSKSPEHVLTDPTASLEDRKCCVHKKILEYFCDVDGDCICVSCCLIGGHKGHEVESLDKFYERKTLEIRDYIQSLTKRKEETQSRIHSLQERRKRDQEKAANESERINTLFRDLRRHLEDLEKRVLSAMSGQAEQASLLMSDLIQKLENKEWNLSLKLYQLEGLCEITDPLTLAQQSDFLLAMIYYEDQYYDEEEDEEEEGDEEEEEEDEDTEEPEKELHDGWDLDVTEISRTYNTLLDMVTEIKLGIYGKKAADLLLDINTSSNYLQLSKDRKTATTSQHQKHPETPERFLQYSQVLSSQSFSSGSHYWEVDVRGSSSWRVGMSYPSIDRKGEQSWIGHNNKSWCLDRDYDQYVATHNKITSKLPVKISSNRVRICLDYEIGQISFYDLCDPVQHLHTFKATFTEPLHAALYIWKGCVKVFRVDQK